MNNILNDGLVRESRGVNRPEALSFSVYRVSGLPPARSIEDTAGLLERSPDTSSEKSGLQITSLAEDCYQSNRQVATLTFSKTPESLLALNDENQWAIKLLDKDYVSDTGRNEALIFDTHFCGLTPLNTVGTTADSTDCIVVCGLGTNAFGTFKEKGGSYMWLRDSLPSDLPNMRVLLYGYKSELRDSYSNQNVSIIADNLAGHFSILRRQSNTISKPLIIIAQSLGGLITKQAIIKLSRGTDSEKEQIRSIVGMLFFGVPNRGMDIDSLRAVVGDRPNRYLLESIGKSSDFLLEQNVNFPLAFPFRDSPIFSFFETQSSPTAVEVDGFWKMAGPRKLLVDRFSATYPRPWDSDSFHEPFDRTHSNLVKFSVGDIDYQRVLFKLREIRSKATTLLTSRFHDQESPNVLNLEEEACLRSPSFTHMHARESNIEPAAEDTGNWLLESADFQSWAQRERLDEHHGFFWLKGNPGSGKSTLMKKTYSHMKREMTDPSSIIAGFFFNARGSEDEKSSVGLFRTLLHTLCRQMSALRTLVVRNYSEKTRVLRSGWEWHLGELKALLKSVVTAPILGNRNLILFVDALDECDLAGARAVIQYFEHLANSAVKEGTKFNICLSSRYWPQLTIRICFHARVETQNQNDIAEYIGQNMVFAKDRGGRSDYLTASARQIMDKASGIFLWVVLVVEDLLHKVAAGATLADLQKVIRRIPSDLGDFYRHQLQNIEPDDQAELLSLLQCVFFSQRPLSLTELRYALAFGCGTFTSYADWSQSSKYVDGDEQMEKRLRERSKGLIEVKTLPPDDSFRPWDWHPLPKFLRPKSVVQFIHESVKDYLQARGFDILIQDRRHNQTAQGHEFMKAICMNYLNSRELVMMPIIDSRLNTEFAVQRSMPTLFEDYPFVEYMIDFLFIHSVHAEENGLGQDHLRAGIFGNIQGCFERWRHLFDLVSIERDDHFLTGGTNYHWVPRRQGLDAQPIHVLSQYGLLTQELAMKEGDTNVPGGLYNFALHAAVAEGHQAAVQFLLESGADPKLYATGQEITAFHWAVQRENVFMLRQLLKDNLSLMSIVVRLRILERAYQSTSLFYRCLELLLPETRIPETAMDAVSGIARWGDPEVLSFVLDRCDRSVLNKEWLWHACSENPFSRGRMIKILLDRGGRVNITPALLSALRKTLDRDDEAISLLFERPEIEVDESLIDSICLIRNSSQIFRQLEVARIDLPPFTRRHLLCALENGSADSVAFIIQRIDDAGSSDGMLLAATKHNDEDGEVMRLLLSWRNIDHVEDDVMITVAGSFHYESSLKVLEDRFGRLNFPMEALAAAIPRRLPHVFKSVLERCESFAITEGLLVAAVRSSPRPDEKVALLLENDPAFDVSGEVIKVAVADWHAVDILDLLLQQGKPILLTEEIVEAAASNYDPGPDALHIILQQNPGARITDSMMQSAVKASRGAAFISIMLEHDPNIRIREEWLISAAMNEGDGSTIFALLHERGKITNLNMAADIRDTTPGKRSASREPHPQITAKVKDAVMSNQSDKQKLRLQSLFEEWGAFRGQETSLSQSNEPKASGDNTDQEILRISDPAVSKSNSQSAGSTNKKRNRRQQAEEDSTQQDPSGIEHAEADSHPPRQRRQRANQRATPRARQPAVTAREVEEQEEEQRAETYSEADGEGGFVPIERGVSTRRGRGRAISRGEERQRVRGRGQAGRGVPASTATRQRRRQAPLPARSRDDVMDL